MNKKLFSFLCAILGLCITACGSKEKPDAETPIIEDVVGLPDEMEEHENTDDDNSVTSAEDEILDEDPIEDIEEETLLGKGYDNPLRVGDSINFQYLDYMHMDAETSQPIVDCIITYNSYQDGVVHLTFEVVSYVKNTPVIVNESLGSLYYYSIDENLARTFIDYKEIYKEDDGSYRFSVYESGKLDYCVNIAEGRYLTLDYVPPTENNLNKEKNQYYSEDSIWFDLQQ